LAPESDFHSITKGPPLDKRGQQLHFTVNTPE
jgi:hypothetical protein